MAWKWDCIGRLVADAAVAVAAADAAGKVSANKDARAVSRASPLGSTYDEDAKRRWSFKQGERGWLRYTWGKVE